MTRRAAAPPRIPALSEGQWQRQVTELAQICGWEYVHFRPARTEQGWRTPVSGTLGAGWPDLLLVRARDRRLVFAELKRDGTKTSPEQDRVLDVLRHLCRDRVQVCVWRPADLPDVQAVLR